VKCIDPVIHKSLTGQAFAAHAGFCRIPYSQKGIPVWIRHVLVPGITDNDHLLEKHADYIAGLKNVERVELLPFHNRGYEKYKSLGMEYPLKDTEPPTAERIENAKEHLQKKRVNGHVNTAPKRGNVCESIMQ
jgi:pyruvate formate lyase activating enzyme